MSAPKAVVETRKDRHGSWKWRIVVEDQVVAESAGSWNSSDKAAKEGRTRAHSVDPDEFVWRDRSGDITDDEPATK